jgi:hypothetical protein
MLESFIPAYPVLKKHDFSQFRLDVTNNFDHFVFFHFTQLLPMQIKKTFNIFTQVHLSILTTELSENLFICP